MCFGSFVILQIYVSHLKWVIFISQVNRIQKVSKDVLADFIKSLNTSKFNWDANKVCTTSIQLHSLQSVNYHSRNALGFVSRFTYRIECPNSQHI